MNNQPSITDEYNATPEVLMSRLESEAGEIDHAAIVRGPLVFTYGKAPMMNLPDCGLVLRYKNGNFLAIHRDNALVVLNNGFLTRHQIRIQWAG